MTDLEQLSKDTVNVLTTAINNNPTVKDILNKYAKKYPGENLATWILYRMDESEKPIIVSYFFKALDPLAREFIAENDI